MAVVLNVTKFLQYDVKHHLPLLCHWHIININLLFSPHLSKTQWTEIFEFLKKSFLQFLSFVFK